MTNATRRLTGVILALLLTLGARANAGATVAEDCGDADESGDRTVTDGVRILRTAAELAGGCAIASRCDIDGNGAITVSDGVAALRLAADLPVSLACPNLVIDRSEFAFFSFFRRPAFGYCPPLDSVSRVFLSVGDAGILREALVIVEGNPGDPDCLTAATTIPPVACAREVALPNRLLTAEEVERVRSVFSAVTREQRQNPDCKRIAFDPCLLNEFTWNASTITDFICGQPRLLPDQSAALIAVLDSLR